MSIMLRGHKVILRDMTEEDIRKTYYDAIKMGILREVWDALEKK